MKNDLSGRQFGRLTALTVAAEKKYTQIAWVCRCECGNTTTVCGSSLRRGATKSCGCLASSVTRKRSTTHGKRRGPAYTTWLNMVQRCTNENNPAYPNYGGRGIVVCKRWAKFAIFFEDMGERPHRSSIERIDNDGPYCAENCRWATSREQNNNRRTNVRLSFCGREQTVTEWAREVGISPDTMMARVKAGWATPDVITRRLRRRAK